MNPPRAAVPLIFLIPALFPPSPVEFLMLILRVWPIPMGFSLHGVTTSPSPSAPRKPSQGTANIHFFFGAFLWRSLCLCFFLVGYGYFLFHMWWDGRCLLVWRKEFLGQKSWNEMSLMCLQPKPFQDSINSITAGICSRGCSQY